MPPPPPLPLPPDPRQFLGVDSPFFSTIVLSKTSYCPRDSGGFLETRIPGKNGNGRYPQDSNLSIFKIVGPTLALLGSTFGGFGGPSGRRYLDSCIAPAAWPRRVGTPGGSLAPGLHRPRGAALEAKASPTKRDRANGLDLGGWVVAGGFSYPRKKSEGLKSNNSFFRREPILGWFNKTFLEGSPKWAGYTKGQPIPLPWSSKDPQNQGPS